MDVKECYLILELKNGAGLDEIKAAYRRMAFKLHPDLNPDDPQAGQNFQRLNEAYVILQEAVNGETRFAGNTRRTQKSAKPSGSQRAAGAKPKGATPGASAPGAAKAKAARPAGTAGAKAQAYGAKPKAKRDVIKNIMNDPFARKVFEDIYSQIRSGEDAPTGQVKKREVSLKWGDKELSLDLSNGLGAGLKGWFKRQFDDEQTIYLPPAQLLPGSRLKIQIRRAWSGKPVSVEIPLPSDYIVGRPIRLRGLGRQLGPIKGDLYLRLLAK